MTKRPIDADISRAGNGLHVEITFDRPVQWWDTHLVPALIEHGRALAIRIRGRMERFLDNAPVERRPGFRAA
jgi:hypothetical protein